MILLWDYIFVNRDLECAVPLNREEDREWGGGIFCEERKSGRL